MNLGQYIQNKRRQMYLTQEELAEKINVSKSAVAKWETNGGIPDRDNLKKLSDIFSVSIDELHRVIKWENLKDVDFDVNITPEVIAALEAAGYKVTRPGEEGN